LSRTVKWAFALLLAACVYAPATALAEPVPSDLPQADAASEAGETAPVEGDGATIDDDTADAVAPSDALQEDTAPNMSAKPDDSSAAAADDVTALQGEEGSDTDALAASRTEEGREPAKSTEPKAAVPSPTKTPAKAQRAPAARGPIYVNGSTGNDANAGTEAAPVKTFAKAKELLEASGGEAIYVSGALQVSGDAGTWELGGKTLARGDGYHGELIKLVQNAVLTLKNIILDGRSDEGQMGVVSGGDGGGGSLVGVYGGTLTVGEGAVLQNNSVESRGAWYPEGGGAIFANKGTVNVEGGTIRNNEAVLGGGIYGIYDSVINMSSGTIEGNRAIQGASTTLPTSYGGNGGGICAANGTDVNFSGGTISGNSAFERGGGISMGTYYASEWDSPVLTMTGGTISGNTAGSAGGGLFVQAGYSASGNGGTPTYAIARITAGDITGNSVTATGEGSPEFGGGGIYVNGYSSAYTAFHNGELYLANVEVSGNSAAIEGGGYAACPVSVTEINLTNGAAFYGNSTDGGKARELFIKASLYYGSHSGDPVYEISPSMLGGGAYKWVYDDGTEVPLDDLKGVLSAFYNETLSLSNDLAADDPAVQTALSRVKVHITGNTSVTRGGGIGSNGSVFIGKSVDTIEIPVSKVWNDGNDKEGLRPESVKVNLYRDGEYVGYQTMEPDDDGTWTMTFENLPKNDADGHEYTYTVEERAVDGYTATITGSVADGFSIANTVTVTVSGTKVWNDADDQDGMRPDSITVNLMRNGEKLDSKLVTAEDGWAFLFAGLAKYDADGNEYVYTVAEDAVEGYGSAIAGEAKTGFTITNSHTPETISISVIKKWVGGEGPAVTIHLFADGIDTGKALTLDGSSAWKGLFTDLPKYRSGKQISYTIAEDAVEGYSSQVEGDAANGFIVTNTKDGTSGKPGSSTPDEPGKSTPEQSGFVGTLPATGDSPAIPIALFAIVLACVAAALAARRRVSLAEKGSIALSRHSTK
jgi:LPXTG-motif cell wall-anchored protein